MSYDMRDKLNRILNTNLSNNLSSSTNFQQTETSNFSSRRSYNNFEKILQTEDSKNLKQSKSNFNSPLTNYLQNSRLLSPTSTITSADTNSNILNNSKKNDYVSSFTGLSINFNKQSKKVEEYKNSLLIKNDVFNLTNTKTKSNFNPTLISTISSRRNENVVSNFSKNAPKVRKEIDYLSRVFSKDKKDFSMINKPFITLEGKPEMDFSSRNYFELSPTNTRKNYLVTSSHRKVKEQKKEPLNLMTLNLKLAKKNEEAKKTNLLRSTETNEIENYLKDFETNRKKTISLEQYTSERRNLKQNKFDFY